MSTSASRKTQAGGRERTAAPSRPRAPGRGPERRSARAPAAPALRQAGNQAVQRMLRPGAAPAISAAPAPALQRCGCGGGAPPIGAAPMPLLQRCCGGGGAPPLADPLLQRQAAGPAPAAAAPASAVPDDAGRPLDPGTRAFMESRFGRDFRDVRIHTGPAADDAARDLNARAFTVGQDVVFGAGEYDPGSPGGRRLLAHELVHTVQQAHAPAAAPQTALRVSEPGDALEREADRVAAQVVDGSGPAAPVTPARPGVQRQVLPSWSDIEAGAAAVWEETAETAEAIAEGAEEVVDTVAGFAREVWDQATALASALGSVVTISGTQLIIDVPSVPACPDLSFQFSLPEIGRDIPFAIGVVPVTGVVSIYGMLAVHLGFVPEVSAQLGPCQLHGLRIVIDPLGPSFSAAGSLTATVGLGLGAELRAALKGEVGVLIAWPDPPLLLQIPVASVEAGLAGFGRGIAISQVTVAGAMSYSGGRFSLAATRHEDLGLAADLGLAGYGGLRLLGFNLCRLYWPFLEWHGDLTLSSDLALAVTADSSGVAGSLVISPPQLNAVPFDALGLQIPREMFADECPLCDAFYALGLMPSQRGGGWHGHPTPPWAGPLGVYPRTPGIPSGAKCRGACGPDCDTCSPPTDLVVCEETPDGRHWFWIYPNYQECGSHDGCRQHDGSYDWCAAGGEMSILGPCHRVADFECICNYNAPQCVGWIFGNPPHDSVMAFSDAPVLTGFCVGPCPEATVTPEGETQFQLCLPDIPLVDRTELFTESWTATTGEILLGTVPIPVPYLGEIPVSILAEAEAAADLSAAVGPVWLSGICLDVDPVHGIYAGHAELHVQAGVEGSLELTGTVSADAGWRCLFSVVRIDGSLIGRGDASLDAELTDFVDVSCRNGEIVLDNSVSLGACLSTLLGLDAGLVVRLFGYRIISERWNLLEREWADCWDVDLGVTSLPLGGALVDFDAEDVDPTPLLSWLFEVAGQDEQLLERLTRPAPRRTQAPGAGAGSRAPVPAGAGAGDVTDAFSMPSDPAGVLGISNPCGGGGADDCPVPVNLRIVEASDIGGGVLFFRYQFDSSTGDIRDLGNCELSEYVTYDGPNPYVWPSPPWDGGASRNPTFEWNPVVGRFLVDRHKTFGFLKPYRRASFRATQVYQYRTPCKNNGQPVTMSRTLTIARGVVQRLDGKWKYRVTKSGYAAEIDPLPD